MAQPQSAGSEALAIRRRCATPSGPNGSDENSLIESSVGDEESPLSARVGGDFPRASGASPASFRGGGRRFRVIELPLSLLRRVVLGLRLVGIRENGLVSSALRNSCWNSSDEKLQQANRIAEDRGVERKALLGAKF